jgi:hypothetical protein
MLFVLMTPLFAQLSLAATPPKVDVSCAKVALSAIYGAEKSHHAEYNFYSDSFDAIGYVPEPQERCAGWKSEVRVFNGGKEFLAECSHPSGKRFTINDRKELKEE